MMLTEQETKLFEEITNNSKFLEIYLDEKSMFLCNDDGRLASFSQLGGDWDTLMTLVEERKVFYSRLYKTRVTYISNRLYWSIKPYKQRLEKVSEKSKEIFEFLDVFGEATTPEIKEVLALSGKTFSQCIKELSKELLITATARDRKINNNWSSFFWGTYKVWEKTAIPYKPGDKEEYKLLEPVFSRKEIENLLK